MQKNLFSLLIALLVLSCKTTEKQMAYKTDSLEIGTLTEHTYLHTSFLETESFGRVACNGMIVVNNGEAIVFDTPSNNIVSKELMDWLDTQNVTVKAVVATHFHDDCVGGLKTFHQRGVPSYAHQETIRLLAGNETEIPQNGFTDITELRVGNKKVILEFMGAGHTNDNIIGFFPSEKIMFGGCLIKSIGAGKGNLEDANVMEWPKTVSKIKSKYPNTSIIVPGHGNYGDGELLDYTITLFKG